MTRVLAPLFLVVTLAASTRAQPLHYTVNTLEWLAADSRVVVRATIAAYDRQTDDSGLVRDTIVLRVRETLKGPHKPFHTFVINNRCYQDDLPRWKNSNCELLAFLIESKRIKSVGYEEEPEKLAAYELVPHYISHGRPALIELAVPEKPRTGLGSAFTMDFKTLSSPREILGHARAAVAAVRPIDRLPSHTVRSPSEGAIIDWVVPVDERLERRARKWTASSDLSLRTEGAKALGHFRSDENVAILKRLLDDASYSTEVREEGGRVIPIARVYEVRSAAYTSLGKLGIRVSKPVLRVPLPQEGGSKDKAKSQQASTPRG